MAREKTYNELRPVGTDPKTLTTPEVQAWLARDLAHTVLMRSILMAEIQAVKAGAARETRTLRGLWYEVVKPLISRAGELYRETSTSTEKKKKYVDWDTKLSQGLADLVREGITSYEELSIIDGSRQRQKSQRLTAPLIDVEMVGDHYPWIVLFIEKDTTWPVVQSLANLYGVSAISGGGEPSNACSENITREIIKSKAFQEAKPERLIILSLTDYDPHGYIIESAQQTQITEAAEVIRDRGNLKYIELIRVGVEPDQLTRAEIEANAYQLENNQVKDWIRDTGGINGQTLGLELDSLPLSRLRVMFADEIEKHIDLTSRYDDLRQAYIDLMACDQLLPEFNQRRNALIDQAEASEVGQAIKAVPLPTNLFREAAVRGADWISPQQTLKLFSDYQDRLTELWKGNH